MSTVRVRDEYAQWLALSRVKGLGGVGFKKLAASFADPTQAFFASPAELERVEGLHREVIEGIANFSGWVEIDDELRRVRAAGIDIVRFTSPRYPARLRMIADPPPLLYIKGTLTGEDERAVAIVGSRSASDYGRRVARDLARGLASLWIYRRQRHGARHRRHGPRERVALPAAAPSRCWVPGSSAPIRRSMKSFTAHRRTTAR